MIEDVASGWRGFPVRPMAWTLAAGLLLLPAVAMRFSDEVRWTASDFVFAGVLIGGVGLAFEMLVRRGAAAYRVGAACALLAVFGLVWLNAAVGIIGSEDDPANFMFAGVIAVFVGGAAMARLRALGMARACVAAAVAQVLVCGVAMGGRMGADGPVWPADVLALTAGFTGLWALAAWLFGRAFARA
jgi:hypothetical protein